MNSSTDSDSVQTASPFFRCPVQSANSKAQIQIGFRKVPVNVQERSIDGFTVLVSSKSSRRLKVGGPWTMYYDGSEVEVHPQWFFNSPDGQVQMGLRQVRDMTKLQVKTGSFWSKVRPRRKYENSASSSAALGGFVLVLFCALALPGLGDKLGTSTRIQDSVRWFVNSADAQIDDWLR
tara:strand:- start:56397 stop:56930 length:534 start_codon:yes stop_codon:yes gene_type:complete